METCNNNYDSKPQKNKSDPESHHPISLLSISSKMFECLLLPKLQSDLSDIIQNTQLAFRSQHSCLKPLHRIVGTILDTYQNKKVCLGYFF